MFTAILTTTLLVLLTITTLLFLRLYQILTRPKPTPQHKTKRKGHLLILLGSGGHTSEMMSVLNTLGPDYLDTRFDRRTWVVSSGDGFSAERAREFEVGLASERERERDGKREGGSGRGGGGVEWDIITVRRARKVHQSLLTTPMSALGCLSDSLAVLCGNRMGRGAGETSKHTNANTKAQHSYPDLILTNGPGTGVIMVLASLILLFLGIAPVHVNSPSSPATFSSTTHINTDDNDTEVETGSMRSVYIESWARVKKLSLSGRILKFLASRVLVQWRGLGDIDRVRTDKEMGKEESGVLGGDVNYGRKSGSGSGSNSMRIGKRGDRGDGRGGGNVSSIGDGDSGSDTTTWPRRTEYIGAVVT